MLKLADDLLVCNFDGLAKTSTYLTFAYKYLGVQ